MPGFTDSGFVLNCVHLFLTPWTAAHQAPLPMEFCRQEYWSGLPFPSPGGLPIPGIKPMSLASPALTDGFLTTAPPGKTFRNAICVLLSHVRLCESIGCSPPGSSANRISQARILEWVAVLFSKGPSRPRNQTQVSCIASWFFTVWATKEAL